jgi:CRP-like cAMP-binding protein
MEKILAHLASIYPLSDALRDYLVQVVEFRTLKRKDLLLRPGEQARHIYFIKKGILRCYYIKDGDEVSTWFMAEGNVITSVLSFFPQRPGFEYIQALEDCELYGISWDDLQYIYRNFLEFNFISRVLTERYYMQSEERLYSIRRRTARERYNYLVERWPELVLRVKQRYIASYMDLGPGTMSRNKES